MQSALRIFLFVMIGVMPLLGLNYLFLTNQIFPILTSSLSFDDKAYHAATSAIRKADVLALGSSATLNNLHSATISAYLGPGSTYFNFASWGLRIENHLDLAEVLVSHFEPKVVVIVSAPVDFEGEKIELAAPHEVRWYLKGWFSWFFLKEPNIQKLVSRRTLRLDYSKDRSSIESSKFDEAGGIDLTYPPGHKTLDRYKIYDRLAKAGDRHYLALDSLAHYLSQKGIRLILVDTYLRDTDCTDPDCQALLQAHAQRKEQILRHRRQYYINLHQAGAERPDSIFADEFHLTNGGAEMLTRDILARVDMKPLLENPISVHP